MPEPALTVSIFQKDAPETFAAGQIIFEVGQPGAVMYGVIEGEVSLVVNNKVVETIKTGDVFGEGALVRQAGTRASTAIAQTDCKLASLDEKRFLFALENTPMFAVEVVRSFSDRLRRLKQVV